jgi:hypothetical protein
VTETGQVPAGVDMSRPSVARMYDYFLGGTHNFPVDREAGDKLKAAAPDVEDTAWANRGFHGRAARWMASERGIRQFIDIGSGLPTQRNTHEVVREILPDARVVYVDIDPMVFVLSDDLLDERGTTAVIEADLKDPDDVLGRPGLRELIDFAEPVGLLMTGVMHFIADSDDPYGIVARYMDALTPGSCLAISHACPDMIPRHQMRLGSEIYQKSSAAFYPRTRAQIERFFDGLELVAPYPGAAPGVATVGVWGAEDSVMADSDGSRAAMCGVARKP